MTIVDHQSKTVFLEYGDPDDPIICPICGKPWKSNGTGPTSLPLVAKFLQMLPSEKKLGGFPPKFHDLAFLICPEGWAVSAKYGSLEVTAVDFDSANDGYRDLMKAQAARRSRILRKMWQDIADRNYAFVCEFGRSSYRHDHSEKK